MGITKKNVVKQTEEMARNSRPLEWCRFGLFVPPSHAAADGPTHLRVFKRWLKCYHGTGNSRMDITQKILNSVLPASALMIPGDVTPDETELKISPDSIQGEWGLNVFTSPSIGYAEWYAARRTVTVIPPAESKLPPRQIQLILQLRQLPESFVVHRQTIGGFNDPHIDPTGEAVEWVTSRRHIFCIYGLLARFAAR